jgi:CDP-2,3-bis-(O-geranylgeranyl)-sn-glycerol synthase
VLAGTVAGVIVAYLYALPFFAGTQEQAIAAFLLSFGALSGDAAGSFMKRRMGIASGKPFIPDTVIFLLVALIFVLPVAEPALYEAGNMAFFIILTMVLHPLTNALANKAGLKSVPW